MAMSGARRSKHHHARGDHWRSSAQFARRIVGCDAGFGACRSDDGYEHSRRKDRAFIFCDLSFEVRPPRLPGSVCYATDRLETLQGRGVLIAGVPLLVHLEMLVRALRRVRRRSPDCARAQRSPRSFTVEVVTKKRRIEDENSCTGIGASTVADPRNLCRTECVEIEDRGGPFESSGNLARVA